MMHYFTEAELAELYQLKNVVRYNNHVRIKDETVAEHSFFTTLLALKLCEKLHASDDLIHKCIIKALLHDMPETKLNDITHDVKSLLNIRPILRQYERSYYDNFFERFSDIMNIDDENDVVNLIVKFADILSVLQYACNEISLGNNTFLHIKIDAEKRLDDIYKKLNEVKIKNGSF